MQIECPACRKANQVESPGEAVCARCGCELGRLALIARAADSDCRRAAAALRRGQPAVALEYAARAWQLRRSPAAAALAAIAAAINGDFHQLEDWRQREAGLAD